MEACQRLNQPLENARVVIQGFGNVGSVAGKLLHEMGAKIIGISDYQGGITRKEGIDITKALDHLSKNKTLAGFSGGDVISNEDLLELPCDILIPAALGGVITKKNAPRLQCRILAEAANAPVTNEADKILIEQGVFIIPDILANAGGVVVSYFEWVQGIQSFFWDLGQINDKLQEILSHAFARVYEVSLKRKTDMRTAALISGISTVSKAMLTRGIYP